MNLKGKVAIVTGSSRGIGWAIAQNMASYGANLVLTARNQAQLDDRAADLKNRFGVDAIGVQCDVGNSESVAGVVNKAQETFGQIDILVNNAGITKDNLLMRMTEEDWSSVIQTNLNAVFFFTKQVIRPMMKQKAGRIINVASVVGLMGNPGQANYAASKGGVIAFTKTIAKEYGSKGILCNAIAPGFIDTDMLDALPKDYLDNIIGQIPAKRLGKPEEIANVVSFLASDLSTYITGQVVQVDGGILM